MSLIRDKTGCFCCSSTEAKKLFSHWTRSWTASSFSSVMMERKISISAASSSGEGFIGVIDLPDEEEELIACIVLVRHMVILLREGWFGQL
ncbi:hypothetical protein [Sediminispirochaeta smaragdinae]|uniref:hypothetical protein n=1 Tax=Sediminispirochaeta smaragdinae TaxID=55206 RepID=UPI0002EAA696|nr:hypothetical protein [Sediminispirochaeta smaragdinae]